MSKLFLAIDTSCYTSSVSLLDENGILLADCRKVLEVPRQQRGLLQSEALFQHIHNIPVFLKELGQKFDLSQVVAIGASVKPRPVEDSYMPVFLGAQSFGETLSVGLGVEMLPFSHQEGHMMAGWYSLDMYRNIPKEFFFCHFSGGTSEVLLASEKDNGEYSLDLKAYGNDLHAGQFVDRIGVLMGLPFPCGKHMEPLAEKAEGEIPTVKIWVKNGEFSFSGQETAIRRLYEKGYSEEVCCRAVEETIARTLIKVFEEQFAKTSVDTALFAGGVMSNQYICNRLKEHFKTKQIYFAAPDYASDNAVGTGVLTLRKYHRNISKK